jgi:hypothetical protein
VMAEIVERTDGIPLFVEEMTKAVLEAEDESEARRTVAAVPSPPQAVPASLHASLMARLDRLGPAKDMAQIGAAIGREFSGRLRNGGQQFVRVEHVHVNDGGEALIGNVKKIRCCVARDTVSLGTSLVAARHAI